MRLPFYNSEANDLMQYRRYAELSILRDMQKIYDFNIWVVVVAQLIMAIFSIAVTLAFIGLIFLFKGASNHPRIVIPLVILFAFYFFFIVGPNIAFHTLKKLGLIKKRPLMDPKIVVYDNNEAAKIMLAHVKSYKPSNSLTIADVSSLLDARDSLINDKARGLNPQEALTMVAKNRGIDTETVRLLDDGEAKYLEKIGVITPHSRPGQQIRNPLLRAVMILAGYALPTAVVWYGIFGPHHAASVSDFGISFSLRNITINGIIVGILAICVVTTITKHHYSRDINIALLATVAAYFALIFFISYGVHVASIDSYNNRWSLATICFVFGFTFSFLLLSVFALTRKALASQK